MPLRTWVQCLCEKCHLHVIPVSREISIAFCELPLLHDDPFDRLIISTAQSNRLAVVTAAAIYSTYLGLDGIW